MIISDRAHPIWKNMTLLREQQWGHLPLTDVVFDFFESISTYTKVETILEFGFNMGYSCSIQKAVYPNATIHTYDPKLWRSGAGISEKEWLREGRYLPSLYGDIVFADLAKVAFGDSFVFYNTGSERAQENHTVGQFDYAFIDGDHSYEAAARDIQTCINLRIPYLAIDNLKMKDVKRAVDDFSILELLNEIEYTQNIRKTSDISSDKLGLYKVNFND